MEEYDDIQKSKHWKKFDERKHLYNETSLENFRNNGLSDGLDDRYSLEKQKEILDDLLAEIGEHFVYSNLTNKNIGNVREYLKVGEKIADGGQLFHIRWLHDLTEHVFSQKDVKYICEIGGGYGSFAQKVFSNVPCTYIMIDLPEANLLASYYLSKHFSRAKILLCDEIEGKKVSKKQVQEYDFIIIPPWYELDADVLIDLFINTRSMMEMNREAIKKYFDLIHRAIAPDGCFFNINRYSKDTVGYPIKFGEYPYDEKWSVVLSRPSWKQGHIHQLITRRTASSGNIQEELNRIEEISQRLLNRNQLKHIQMKVKIVAAEALKSILPRRIYKICKNILKRAQKYHF